MRLPFAPKTLLISATVGLLRKRSIITRTVMLIGVATVVSAIFACSTVQAPPPPIAAAWVSTGAQCGVSTNPSPFLRNLRMLSNYNPVPGPNKVLPAGTSPVLDPYCTSMTNVYNLAAPSFKAALDSLTNTFIDTDSCTGSSPCSWGFIDQLSTNPTGNTYIALSASLWTNGAPTYSTYGAFATQLVTDLLIANGLNPSGAASPISVQANPDSPNLGLLAALAHEMGHLKWWKSSLQTYPCPDPVFPGKTTIFSSIGWTSSPNTPRWRYFGVGSGDVNVDQITIQRLLRDLGTGNEINDLIAFYDGTWPSIFSTVSPDEDYVETYTLEQVVDAMRPASTPKSVASLQVTLLPGTPRSQPIDLLYDHDYPTHSDRRDLNHKAQWVHACGL
jgi:hypothetical protein